ncbi:alpha/beta fold hydrolase [Frankia sp. CiP3]|uniref:alpha/beta fold hydrolase n=1 Tax=Frankia sp. CiP3 TaxID=2880971 RepID=UPI001EF5882C|nr:alpha/beta hydrolase [Frankia sp. CiP3]
MWRAGNGRPLVYLHSTFGEVGDLPLFAELAKAGFQVTAPELPGFGRSEPITSWQRIEDVVFTLRRILDNLGVGPAVFVGSSLGGWLTAEIAVWFPERVDALGLLAPLGLRVDGAPVFEIFGASDEELLSRALPHGRQKLPEYLAPAVADHGDDPSALLVHLFNAIGTTARIGWNPYLHDPALPARLPLVRTPTLVVWGEDDAILPRAHAAAYAAATGGHLKVISGTGHLPALEQPREIAAELAAFILRCDTGQPA